MAFEFAPSEDDIGAVLRSFLASVLPDNMPVIFGQINRTPEPGASDFVVMTPLRQDRIETNIDEFDDVSFTGQISGMTLTVTEVNFGMLSIGAPVFGVDVLPNTKITALGTGTGGEGTYTINNSQNIASRAMGAGGETITQPCQLTWQLDVHGPSSSNNAARIATMFRDEYAVNKFAETSNSVVPLYCEEPRQMPFINAEEQYEYRWVVGAVMQANFAMTKIPQQFAASLSVNTINVEAEYPA